MRIGHKPATYPQNTLQGESHTNNVGHADNEPSESQKNIYIDGINKDFYRMMTDKQITENDALTYKDIPILGPTGGKGVKSKDETLKAQKLDALQANQGLNDPRHVDRFDRDASQSAWNKFCGR